MGLLELLSMPVNTTDVLVYDPSAACPCQIHCLLIGHELSIRHPPSEAQPGPPASGEVPRPLCSIAFCTRNPCSSLAQTAVPSLWPPTSTGQLPTQQSRRFLTVGPSLWGRCLERPSSLRHQLFLVL